MKLLGGDLGHDYQVERHNSVWPDHIMRTYATAAAIAWLRPLTVLDPACGDASIEEAAYNLRPFHGFLADISQPNMDYILRQRFPWVRSAMTNDLFATLSEESDYDVVVLTEILEHLNEPGLALSLARKRAKYLVASSPVDEPNMGNPEHLWSFSQQDYHQLMTEAGWRPDSCQVLSFTDYPYTFQIWTAS